MPITSSTNTFRSAAGKWKKSTAYTTAQRLTQHIVKSDIGQLRVAELTRENMQRFLDVRGISSFSTVNHLRWDLKAICDLAISDGIIQRNRAEQLFTPRLVAPPKQPVMTRAQIATAMSVLDIRERVFCRIAIYVGMQTGEIIALRWSDLRSASDGG